jgi:outer membrane receptor protein involved in Fe transport
VDFGGGYDSKYWGASLFGTFVRAKFLGGKYDGCDVPLVARFNGTFQVYAKPLEYITILARATYFSNSVMGNDYDNTMRKIPSYYTLDFQVNINPTKYFTIFGAIENATDENYASYGYAGSFYPSIGRVLKIGINIKL